MESRRLFLAMMALLGLGLLLLILRHNDGNVVDIENHDFAGLVMKIALLTVIGSSVLAMFRGNFSQALTATLFWVVIGLGLALGYTYRADLKTAYQKVMAEVAPGRAHVVRGPLPMVELIKNRKGEFHVNTQLNGNKVAMLLDTGASAVVLTQEAAKAAGLPLEVLNYTVPIDTANGRAKAAAVTLDKVTVGPIVERSVPALIAPAGQLKTSLLGMSFLTRLESWEVRGDKLVMRGYP